MTTAAGHSWPIPCLCGGRLGYTTDNAGEADGVTHSLPICQWFVDMEPDQLLAAARKRFGIKMPWDVDA